MSAIEFTEGDLLHRHELASRWATVGVSTKSARALVCEVADHYCVTPEEIMGKGRYAQVVRARQAVWLELRRLGWSYPQIGEFAGRDHTTVMAGVRRAEEPRGLRVANGHVAGLGAGLAQGSLVEGQESAQGAFGEAAEGEGFEQGAAWPNERDSVPSHRLEGSVG